MKRFQEEKLGSKWQNLPFLGNSTKWYRYQNRGGTGTTLQRPNGTGTKIKWYVYTHQNRFGTGTDPSGTGATDSCSLDFGILTLLSSNSNTEGIGTLIND